MPLTAFRTPSGPLRVAHHAPGHQRYAWVVRQGDQEAIKDFKQVAAHLDDVILFDSDPIAHVQTIQSLFERLRKHNLKRSPSEARLGATDANFLGHSISPAGLRPNAEKVSALPNMPMPTDVK